MSFLSILLVASAFYFAHARPDQSEAFSGAPANIDDRDIQDAPVVPAESSVPIMDPKVYQQKLFGFMQEVSKAVDLQMSKLNAMKQDELKSTDMSGLAGYVDYWFGRK